MVPQSSIVPQLDCWWTELSQIWERIRPKHITATLQYEEFLKIIILGSWGRGRVRCRVCARGTVRGRANGKARDRGRGTCRARVRGRAKSSARGRIWVRGRGRVRIKWYLSRGQLSQNQLSECQYMYVNPTWPHMTTCAGQCCRWLVQRTRLIMVWHPRDEFRQAVFTLGHSVLWSSALHWWKKAPQLKHRNICFQKCN